MLFDANRVGKKKKRAVSRTPCLSFVYASLVSTFLSFCNFNAPFVIIGDMMSQIAATAMSTYTMIDPTLLGPMKIAETRLKLKMPNNPQFTAPKSTRI